MILTNQHHQNSSDQPTSGTIFQINTTMRLSKRAQTNPRENITDQQDSIHTITVSFGQKFSDQHTSPRINFISRVTSAQGIRIKVHSRWKSLDRVPISRADVHTCDREVAALSGGITTQGRITRVSRPTEIPRSTKNSQTNTTSQEAHRPATRMHRPTT